MDYNQTCSLLISRQKLHPCGLSPWVKQSYKAIQWVKDNGLTLYTSLGQQTWELIVFLAHIKAIKQIMVIPSTHKDHFECQKNHAIEQFHLDLDNVQFQCLYPNGSKSLLYQRDVTIVSNSDVLIPISVRKKGHMSTLISQKQDNSIVQEFQINYQKDRHSLAYQVKKNDLSQKIQHVESDYLIHWTRSCNGPWPTETLYDYYAAILKSNQYPRNAMASLENILSCDRIIASSRHMPDKTPTVSFTALPPKNAITLMRWRSRYRQMSFEPYGIGIEKTYAASIGIQKVRYYAHPKDKPKNVAHWLCQSRGKYSDWRLEKEYRYCGDIRLLDIPREKLVCFCYKDIEAKKIFSKYGITTMAIT